MPGERGGEGPRQREVQEAGSEQAGTWWRIRDRQARCDRGGWCGGQLGGQDGDAELYHSSSWGHTVRVSSEWRRDVRPAAAMEFVHQQVASLACKNLSKIALPVECGPEALNLLFLAVCRKTDVV